MTPDEFDVRAFWTLAETLDLLRSHDRRKMRAWFRAANITTRSSAGALIVTRARLESSLPEVLDEMRRAVVSGVRRVP
jgi:hypothetical protein